MDLIYFNDGKLFISGFQEIGFNNPILIRFNRNKLICIRPYSSFLYSEDDIYFYSFRDPDIRNYFADLFSYRGINGVAFMQTNFTYTEDESVQKNLEALIKANEEMMKTNSKINDFLIIK